MHSFPPSLCMYIVAGMLWPIPKLLPFMAIAGYASAWPLVNQLLGVV